MTMTAASSSGWNPTLSSTAIPHAAFGQQPQQPQQQQPPPQQHQQQQQQQPYPQPSQASVSCLCAFCSPCGCGYCLQQRPLQHHQHHQHLSPSFPDQQQQQHQQQQQQQQQQMPRVRVPPWGPGHCFPPARGSPFPTMPNPITGDHGSSDEALSPPHQDDPLDDIMDSKEATRLQHDMVKSWKQKKRASCEMKTRTQDKYRQVYNSQQRFELEKEYHYQKYITTARKSELSSSLHLSERQIKIWFQNRRAKERRQKKNSGGGRQAAARRETHSPSAGDCGFPNQLDVKQETHS